MFTTLTHPRTRRRVRAASSLAMLSGLFIAIGLAGTGMARAEDDTDPPPPILVLTNVTVPPTTTVPPGPTITIPVDISIPPTTVAPPTVPPTQPESDPTNDIIVPVTAPISVPSTDPAPPPPPAVPPSAPQSLTAKGIHSAVQLSWSVPADSGGSGIDKYEIQRSFSPVGPWASVGTTPSTSAISGGLTNGNTYYFRVRAHNAAGWGTPSTVVSAIPMTWPSAPQNVVATPANYGITLSWQPPANNGGSTVTKYRVIVYSADCVTKLFDYYVSGTTSTPAFSNGNARCFRIEAHNAVGGGALSAKVSAKAGRPTAPASCSGYATVTPSASSDALNIWWNPPSSWGGLAPVSYRVIVTDGFFSYEHTLSPNQLATTFYVGNGQWTAKVWAVNSDGWGWPACTTSPIVVG